MRPARVFLFIAIVGAMICCDGKRDDDIIRYAAMLKGMEGRRVVAEGVISGIMWQHMVAPIASHPRENYLDMRDWQIVVYSKKDIRCRGTARISGTVVKVEGSSKDPRRKEALDEYHIMADTWTCLPTGGTRGAP